MKVVIDRFEGKTAVLELENGEMVNAPAVLFAGAKEGDIVSIQVLEDESREKKKKLDSRLKRLFKD